MKTRKTIVLSKEELEDLILEKYPLDGYSTLIDTDVDKIMLDSFGLGHDDYIRFTFKHDDQIRDED